MEGYHKPVLLREAIEALAVKPGNWYIDATLGDGGHSLEILKLGGRVLALDVDPEAIERAKKRLKDWEEFRVIQGNFRDIKNLIYQQMDLKDQKFDGAIFDLGVSSLQLGSPERGFSFGRDGPLDMRMDPNLGIQALDLVNRLSRKELYELFQSLGEEKHSRRLADALVRAREIKEFQTTKELSGFVERVIGSRDKIHPATKVFQALRIAVNDELAALKMGLAEVIDLIKKDGHIVVISFHSLEDRISKKTLREWEDRGMGQVLTKKPVIPSDQEIADNPRSRSAKMRVFKKYDYN